MLDVRKRWKTMLILLLIIVLTGLTGCASRKDAQINANEETHIQDLANSRIAIVTGTYTALITPEVLPDANYTEYNSPSDALLALASGKVDAFPADESIYHSMLWEGLPYDRIDEPLDISDYGLLFAKGQNLELQAQVNEFLSKIKENGALEALEAKWFSDTEPTEFMDYESLEGPNGTLRVGTSSSVKPFAYMKNGKLAGYDIEFLILFAEEYGYKLLFEDTLFASVLTGVSMGSYDIGAAGFTITDERKENIDFSDVYHTEDLVFMISRAGMVSDNAGFMASLADKFEKTFIREQRWKLIAEGLATTIIISICAVIGGSILGFVLYMLTRSRNAAVAGVTSWVAKVYGKIIAGTPTLVVLMLLYYVVLGKTDINGIIVAVIGFIITFGSFVYNNLKLTVDAVDRGQTEAAYALGYGRNQTFFRIVLPQALLMFLPTYSAEIVGMIKATSVVGYIAVNDLTKMGDIIRSSTYEAFFPLIAVAVIYFLITWGAAGLLGIVQRKLDFRKRKPQNILKGVVR